MDFIIDGFRGALAIFLSRDSEFLGIVFTSMRFSFVSTAIASLAAIPFGIWVGLAKFRGRDLLVTILNTLLALPTVVIGLLFYSILTRRGPLGNFGMLFTPGAVILGQSVLAFPIVAALVAGGVRNLGEGAFVAARTLGAGRLASGFLFFKESKSIVITSVSAAFGRVFSEVGISMMLGGNIRFYTRNITTAIALETSRGAFSLGIALGVVLVAIAFLINATIYNLQLKRI